MSRSGETIAGKYRLGDEIGRGGHGAVYDASNTWTGRRVAVKLLRPEVAAEPEVAARFFQEARTAARLRHPHVVDVLDMGRDEDGALFIAYERLDGAGLDRVLAERSALPPGEALDLLVPVMGALAAAHRAGVIHRDVKPGNIIVARDAAGRALPKLIDFGISKVAEGEALALTRTGALIGTPFYMSPEQIRAQPDLDARTDVWSIGAVLYEALSGRRPFDAPAYHALLLQITTETPPRVDALAPEVSRALADVVHRCLARDRDDRFGSMSELLDAVLALDHTLAERHRAALPGSPDEVGSEPAPTSFATAPTLASSAPEPTPGPTIAASTLPATTEGPRRPVAVVVPREVPRRGVGAPLIALAVVTALGASIAAVTLRARATRPAPTTAPSPPRRTMVDPAFLRVVIRSQRPRFTGCYERALAAHPELVHLRLRVRLHADIAARGRATSVRTDGAEQAPELARCIEQIVSELQFPEFDGGTLALVYPFDFARSP